MMPLAAASLLLAWERGRSRHPLDRALVLHGLAEPGVDHEALADRPLGERNRALLALRRAWFGDALSARVDCPRCGEKLELDLRASELLSHAPPSAKAFEIGGQCFRLPTTRDLALAAREPDMARAAERLVSLLVQNETIPGDADGVRALRLESALEKADPHADLALDLNCNACAHAWVAPLDIASFLWEELESRSLQFLDEVHWLAQAYGWTESEILGLSEARRAAYLERVLA